MIFMGDFSVQLKIISREKLCFVSGEMMESLNCHSVLRNFLCWHYHSGGHLFMPIEMGILKCLKAIGKWQIVSEKETVSNFV